MNKKIKLALAALLGFSAACSSVKNTPAKGVDDQQIEADTVRSSVRPRIIVMYGARPPKALRDQLQEQADSLKPITGRSAVDSLVASEATTPVSEATTPADK